MNDLNREAWTSAPGEISVSIPKAGGGEYVIRMPRTEAETMVAEVFGVLLDQDHQAEADR
jgi:hypothetical protein